MNTRNGFLPLAVCLAAALAIAAPCLGQELPSLDGAEGPVVKLDGEVSNLLFWRNDSDFDAVVPYYNEEGQSAGEAATFFRPLLSIRPADQVELFYEAELGMSYWSRNNPDQWFPAAADFMVYKHRQIWTRFDADFVSFKAGYQQLEDPSRLFLAHWMGAFTMEIELGNIGARLFAGQLPDSTFEGIDAQQNNFVHDNVTFGADFKLLVMDDALTLHAGAYGVGDHRVPRRSLLLCDGFAGAEYAKDNVTATLFAHFQAGSWRSSAVDGTDQAIRAWALAAQAGLDTKYLNLAWSGFVLSADDDHPGNDVLGSFFYSGKNRSRSLMLTEDEVRDRYGNYDEQMSARWGSFLLPAAGMAVTDLSLRGPMYGPLGHELIVATGFTMNPKHSGGERYAGLESDLVLTFDVAAGAQLVGVAQVFFPGKAAAHFVNHVPGSEAVEQVHGFQLGTILKF